MTHLRWGVLGAAKIARNFVCPAIHQAEGAALVALATQSAEKAQPFLARYPGLRIHDSYEALLQDPDIDAVYVPLPNHLHVEWTERALRAGKHVLCEKPIALAASEIDRLIAARDETGLMAAEAFMILHHPQWQRARDLLKDGAIGRLRHVDGVFTYRNTDAGNIRNRAEMGGGGIYDIGVYPLIGTRFVTGREPDDVVARFELESGVDTFARVWAEFGDVSLSFSCGMRLHPRQEMVFHGEEGWLRLTAPFNANVYGPTQLHWARPDGTLMIEDYSGVDHYRLMVEAFCASVQQGLPFACPLEFSQGNQRALDRILTAGQGR
ncbi:Gfo/Idh/MocA family protein [Plastorhodobacter daqingensis]|uniref:Gfo/Idh/MocA family protein n=1 Tax=Plastorhodobacter daqingensis TaxID=1387281 RepID=A0ABW2UIA9_9RHOB